MDTAFLVVFLGNPGREYERTRHNVGWLVADALSNSLAKRASELSVVPSGSLVWNSKFEGQLCSITVNGRKVHCFKPETYMNLSGQAVRKLIDFFKLDASAIITVHDDLEVAFGQITFRVGGGAGGHNGLRSLDSQLGSPNYTRCRVGIGRPKHGDVAAYVLSRFSVDEETVLPLVLDKTAELLIDAVLGKKLPTQKIQAFQDTAPKR